jgi:hypothetical protein
MLGLLRIGLLVPFSKLAPASSCEDGLHYATIMATPKSFLCNTLVPKRTKQKPEAGV